jgi:hypothetical protein
MPQTSPLTTDEVRMCVIAHHKVRKLIKGMAMIMCMEHLPIPSKTTKRVKNIMMNVGRNLLPTHMYQIEEVALVIFVAVFNIMIRNR